MEPAEKHPSGPTVIEEVRAEQPYLLDGYEPGYRAGWDAALAWVSAGRPDANAPSEVM
jgi:hypothetical protein